MTSETRHQELLSKFGGVQCACHPERGVQCEFHARQPRPCPICLAAKRDGVLQRYAGKETYREVPYAAASPDGYVRRGEVELKRMKTSTPFWTCNVCDHCE